MTQFFIKFFSITAFLPGLNILYRLFYFRSLTLLKRLYLNHEEIIDVILTSNTKSPSFVYGQSDYNILIIVTNNAHPKSILREFRKDINKYFLLRSTINTRFIPILNEDEFHSDTIKSYLLRNSYKDCVNWYSILSDKKHTFFIRKQDRFAINYNSFQALDFYLLYAINKKSTKTKFKNIIRAINNLKRYYPSRFPVEVIKTKKKDNHLSILNIIFPKKLEKLVWSNIVYKDEQIEFKQTSGSISKFNLEVNFQKHLESLLTFDFIEDITLTPTLIQINTEQLTGKLFIDIHLNKNLISGNYLEHLSNLRLGILDFQKDLLKLRVRFTSTKLFILQNQDNYYPFPLESYLRQKKTLSLAQRSYVFELEREKTITACIHFMITQFMRFRSLEQKTDLIGSKFIKSLNLMYKYHLILDYLKNDQFELTYHEKEIREHLTPQFSEIESEDPLTQDQWKLVKSQLLYLLKEMRDELSKYDESLKVLKF